jgi:hypothetical protein
MTQAATDTRSDLRDQFDDYGDLRAGFVAAKQLANLLFSGRARRLGGRLVRCGTRNFTLHPAVLVVCCLDEHDEYGLAGVVERSAELEAAGASLHGEVLTVGPARYLVERGVIAIPAESPWGVALPVAS